MTARGNCVSCGFALDPTGFCWQCSGDGRLAKAELPPPVQEKPKPPEPICTHEQNLAGLAMLRAAIFGKPGPMAKHIEQAVRRLNYDGPAPGAVPERRAE